MTTPPDPQALLRSRSYVVLLVLAGVVGVPISAVAWGFLALVSKLQGWIFTDLPKGLGFNGEPLWWPILPLVLAGRPARRGHPVARPARWPTSSPRGSSRPPGPRRRPRPASRRLQELRGPRRLPGPRRLRPAHLRSERPSRERADGPRTPVRIIPNGLGGEPAGRPGVALVQRWRSASDKDQQQEAVPDRQILAVRYGRGSRAWLVSRRLRD